MKEKDTQIVVAISGASGSVYAKILLDKLSKIRDQYKSLNLVFSDTAKEIWKHELGNNVYNEHHFKEYSSHDFYAPFASGSARYDTMIICPCSMGMLGRIANGVSDDLITRAADVILKEKQKLILVPREMPYHLIHIRNMETITLAGGVICPATPSFYSKPQTTEEIVSTVIDRVLDLAGFEIETKRWNG